MTIHATHPFADPPEARDAARRLRGRLPAPVTLWCAGAGESRVGLTVSSVLVAPGDPPQVVGLLDPDADLTAAVRHLGRFVVSVLTPEQRRLAEVFAGLGPAPGGPFAGDADAFVDTPWGPRATASDTWAGVRLEGVRPLGWSLEVTGTLEHVALGEARPLVHLLGRLLAP